MTPLAMWRTNARIAAMTSGANPSGRASGELILDRMVDGVPATPIVGAGGRFISGGISTALFRLLGAGYDAGRRIAGMPIDQIVVAAKHAPDVSASRRVKRCKDADENILALHPPVRCSLNIAHR
jgi:hypothetical protein